MCWGLLPSDRAPEPQVAARAAPETGLPGPRSKRGRGQAKARRSWDQSAPGRENKQPQPAHRKLVRVRCPVVPQAAVFGVKRVSSQSRWLATGPLECFVASGASTPRPALPIRTATCSHPSPHAPSHSRRLLSQLPHASYRRLRAGVPLPRSGRSHQNYRDSPESKEACVSAPPSCCIPRLTRATAECWASSIDNSSVCGIEKERSRRRMAALTTLTGWSSLMTTATES